MKSIQLVARRVMEERDVPLPPDPGPGQVLVRPKAVGICGSDLHWYLDGHIGSNHARFPLILGHEPAGEIVAVGAGAGHLKPGMRVMVEPNMGCGECEFCLAGQANICPRSTFLGSSPTPGLFREYGLVPSSNLVPLPDSLDFATATLMEPLAIILHTMDVAGIRLGETVLVPGAGPIGLLSMALAKMAGASLVIAVDRVPHRLELALKMGADAAVDNTRESVREAVMDRTGGRGVDLVLDAAGRTETVNAGLASLRNGGRLVLIGLPDEPELNIDLHTAMSRELTIRTIRRSARKEHAALELLTSGRVPLALLTHFVPLSGTPQAFEILCNYTDGVGKVIIEVDK